MPEDGVYRLNDFYAVLWPMMKAARDHYPTGYTLRLVSALTPTASYGTELSDALRDFGPGRRSGEHDLKRPDRAPGQQARARQRTALFLERLARSRAD